MQAATPRGINCIYIRQTEALGLGHAVLCAAPVVGDEPFAVLLADDLIDARVPVMAQMAEVAAREDCSVIGVMTVSPCGDRQLRDRRDRRDGRPVGADPAHRREAEARHDAVDARGRRPVRADRADLPPPAHDARRAPAARSSSPTASPRLIAEERVLAFAFEGRRYDCGSKLGYLEATVDYGLKHPELAEDFAAFLRERGTAAPSMTLNELRYIVAVANERSFGRAAQRCFVSQPALSVAIQKLEEELGARLFERGKSEITVTPVGARIVEQAQRVLEEAAQIREIAQSGRNQLAGPLKLGVIFTVAPYLLPDLIPALHERAPQMPLDLEENLTEHLEAALKSGRIDAAIIALPFAPPGVVDRIPVRGAVPGGRARRDTGGPVGSRSGRTSSPPSTRSCSTSATASATRCSTPVPSSTAPKRT